MKKFKIVAMIPARLGSKRIRHKNLRLLGGKPLVCHVVGKCKQAGIFDDIYINSEADIFSDVASDYGIKFYKRNPALASDTATNDHFAQDFIDHVPCDILIQVNPTSPLISIDDIKRFVNVMLNGNYDTLHTVKEEQIEALFDGRPLNFKPEGIMPRSQDLKPVSLFVSAIMGWKTKMHTENMKTLGGATYGGKGKTGYFVLNGFSTIDIDNEDDFRLAEIAIRYLLEGGGSEVKYYQRETKNEHSEVDVPKILKKDGVSRNNLHSANKEVVHVPDLLKRYKNSRSWSHRVVNTENNSATLICQRPGEGNRLHYHSDWNEWWYIVAGKWQWEVEGRKLIVREGDVVFISKGKVHRITAVGKKPAIRLAVSREDVAHIYSDA